MLVASVLSEITEAITSTIGDYGLYAVFALMLIDAVLPAASEVVMVYGGALASGAFAGQSVTFFGSTIDEGIPAYVAIALAGTIGYTLGAIGGWAIGLYGGRPYLERHGRWLHLDARKLDRAERWFDRWDDLAVLIGRVLPVVRSFTSIPAGVFRMPLGRYTVLTLVGSAVWNTVLVSAGYALGSQWERVADVIGPVSKPLVAVVVVVAAGALLWHGLRARRERTE